MLQPSVPAWFEIPTHDLERAARFYEQAFETSLKRTEMGGTSLAVFPRVCPAPGGALIKGTGFTPAESGTVVYLNLDDIRPVLERVPGAGGQVLLPLTELPPGMGVFAHFRDTEGNRVGLYSAV